MEKNSLLCKIYFSNKPKSTTVCRDLFQEDSKKDLHLVPEGQFFSPINWGWRAGGSFLTPSRCWGFVYGSYSNLKIALKDPPGPLKGPSRAIRKKIKHSGQTCPFWQAFKELSALAGSQRGGSVGGMRLALHPFQWGQQNIYTIFIFSSLEQFFC